jgi:hypothetical protein
MTLQFDASKSGDDIKLGEIPLDLSGSAASNLSYCQLLNETAPLNSGANGVTPLNRTGPLTFVLDGTFTVSRGSILSLTLKCNVSATAASGGTVIWGINQNDSAWYADGVQSNISIVPAVQSSEGQTATVI